MSPLPERFTLLQVVPRLDIGGAEQTTLDVAAAVVRAGGRAIVASAGGRMTAALIASGAEFVAMPVDSKNPMVMAANGKALAKLIRQEHVSIVHVRSRAPAFSALWAARRTATPVLATYHGAYKAKSALKRWYNGVITRGDMVIANSHFTREHLMAQHAVDPAKVVVIARGVDLTRFDPARVAPERVTALRERWGLKPGDARVKLLLAGRLTRWKGQLLAIEALARLRERGQANGVLILVGDSQGRDGYVAELEAAIARHGLGGQVLLPGPCEDMPAAYLAADIALAPSLEPEAFGRTAVEPQLMGRLAIAADHGAARETILPGQTGWLAAPGDAEAWATAIGDAIAAGPERRAAMGVEALARARALYAVQVMTDATLEVYSAMLAERGPSPR
ncbi:MAG TPA: glycosyltransferase family 4 protein [Caulobacteraceae bacterium]|nr:glycosyltransferase family 4 protein [Caulobacteraceae bacterium]